MTYYETELELEDTKTDPSEMEDEDFYDEDEWEDWDEDDDERYDDEDDDF